VGSHWEKSVADPPQSDDELARRNNAQLAAFVGHIAPETRAPDREDIVQDAWVNALAHRNRIPSDLSQERKWLRAVTRNLVRDRWRRSERDHVRGPRAAGAAILSTPGADEFVMADLESDTVRAAFERLSPLQRRVLELRILEGRPAAETAVLVKRRPDDVRQIQFRAVAALRRDLGAAGWLDDKGGVQ
jgi:RNA polymerase sigma-70 factor (ECF subfamily)